VETAHRECRKQNENSDANSKTAGTCGARGRSRRIEFANARSFPCIDGFRGVYSPP
jgi:hypothetical protein